MGILIQDQYTDADGTNLSGRSPSPIDGPSATYSIDAGVWEILSDRAIPSSYNANTQFAVLNTTFSDDLTVSLDVVVPDGSLTSFRMVGGLVFRYVDPSNFWAIIVQNDNASGTNDYYTRIAKVVAGVETTTTLESGLNFNNTTQNISVQITGTNFTVKRGGATFTPAGNSFNQTATKAGLLMFANGNNHTTQYDFCSLDNLEVQVVSPVQGACLLIP